VLDRTTERPRRRDARGQRPGHDRRQLRGAQVADPSRGHLRPRPAPLLGRAPGDGDGACRHGRRHAVAHALRRAAVPQRPRAAGPRDQRRHRRLRAARAAARGRVHHRDHGQPPRPHLRRAGRPHRGDDRPLRGRPAPAPHHRQDRGHGRPPGRRRLAHGRRPAAGRLARERDRPPRDHRRSGDDDPQVREDALDRRGPRAARQHVGGRRRVPRPLHPGQAQHPRGGRHGLRQDDAAQRALELRAACGADRDRRGRGGAPAAPASRPPSGVAAGQRGGERRHRDPRPRAERPAHATRPDHRRRGPGTRGARHAPGHEHRARRLAVHDPLQLPARRHVAARDDGPDGRLPAAPPRDPGADLLGPRPHRAGRAARRRGPACHAGDRGAPDGGRPGHAAGPVRVPVPEDGRPARGHPQRRRTARGHGSAPEPDRQVHPARRRGS
ncbi:MAG: Type II/IV secretion system ATP hydrolase TadA/VirB11/CpaF, TadA subfamily, partial [uncultured Thermoleophilia bacterium]